MTRLHFHWPTVTRWIGTYRLQDCRCGARRVAWTDRARVSRQSPWGPPEDIYRQACDATGQPS